MATAPWLELAILISARSLSKVSSRRLPSRMPCSNNCPMHADIYPCFPCTFPSHYGVSFLIGIRSSSTRSPHHLPFFSRYITRS
ncbi:hypothetical protein EDB83DRAFT_185347 [Lactarius deliciosus]|nr:hypothetical protein EDB83DRAFT_185347 [Lactarius deliciosus]